MKIIFYIFLLVNLTFTYSRESIITQIRLLIDYKNNTEVCGGRNYYIKEGPVVNFTSEFQESIKLKVKDSFDMFLLTFTPDFSGQIKNIPDIKYWNKHPFAEFGLIGLTNTLRQNIYFSNLHSRQIVSFPKIQEILKTLQSNQPENGILKIIESYLDFHASDTSAALKNLKIAVALPQMSNQSES
ncbi:MAG TPA: hypothetical protein PLQ81_15400, partial [bacterium]|nr:hypothetical protein [bacterium]